AQAPPVRLRIPRELSAPAGEFPVCGRLGPILPVPGHTPGRPCSELAVCRDTLFGQAAAPEGGRLRIWRRRLYPVVGRARGALDYRRAPCRLVYENRTGIGKDRHEELRAALA